MSWLSPLRSVLYFNAGVVGEHGIFASSLHIQGDVVDGFDVKPNPKDILVDLDGAFIFPGLINAHDHLELNHYGRVKFQEKYANASEWVKDMSAQLAANKSLMQGRSKPLADRLFIGGLKNLLSGVTTVAHHNPLYKELRRPFPLRVIKNYGWAHSLYLQNGNAGANGESAGDVSIKYHQTPKNHPFMVHAAEGVDELARDEFRKIKAIGCLGANTILIHGAGFSVEDWCELAFLGAGMVWCPASNIFLLGQTIPIREFMQAGGSSQFALGTDSRLTGSRDLLEEMRFALKMSDLTAKEIFLMVTQNPARMIRLPSAGILSVGSPSDLLVIPPISADPFEALVSCSRKDILLVTINGEPKYGAPKFSDLFKQLKVKASLIRVDGEEKLLTDFCATRLKKCSILESGVVCLKS